MILLVADTANAATRSALLSREQNLLSLRIGSPRFSSDLEKALERSDLELTILECGAEEKACLTLISSLKKKRSDVPIFFVAFAGGDRAIAEAYRRGVRFCFGETFDLIQFKDRVYHLCSARRRTHAQREPLLPPEDLERDDRVRAGALPDGIAKAITYIEDHLADRKLTLQRIARAACMSTFHFCRAFKKHISDTPMRFLARRRVERAKQMLRSQSKRLSVGEIAVVAGFSDASCLSRQFKRFTGTTPRQYRQSSQPAKDIA